MARDKTIERLVKRAKHHLHIQIYSSIAPTFGTKFQPRKRQTDATPALTAVGGEPGSEDAAVGAGDDCGVVIVVDERETGRALRHGDVDV